MTTTAATELGCNLGHLVGLAGLVDAVRLFGLWVRPPGLHRKHLGLKLLYKTTYRM